MDVIPVVEDCSVRRASDQSESRFQPLRALNGLPSRMAAFLFFAPQNGLLHYWKTLQIYRPDLQGPLPLELI